MTAAKGKERAPIQATVLDRGPEMAPVKKRGPYIRDKNLKSAFRQLVRRGLSVGTVRKQLQADFPDARLPSDRTIERWAAEYRKAQGDVPWQWTGKDGDNWTLDVQTAVFQFTQGQGFISDKEAEAVKTIHGLVPNMPPLTAWFFCQEIVDTPKGMDLQHIFNSLGFARRVSVRDGIAPETVEAHVASHVRHWRDRPLMAWAPNYDVATLYINILGPYLGTDHATWGGDIEGGQFLWLMIHKETERPAHTPWGERIRGERMDPRASEYMPNWSRKGGTK